jgi:transposase-like protein
MSHKKINNAPMDKMEFDSVNGVHCAEENSDIIEKCPFCGGEHIVKNCKKYNRQRHLCRNCKKSFCIVDGRIKRSIKERELCLLLCSHNMSQRSIYKAL